MISNSSTKYSVLSPRNFDVSYAEFLINGGPELTLVGSENKVLNECLAMVNNACSHEFLHKKYFFSQLLHFLHQIWTTFESKFSKNQ